MIDVIAHNPETGEVTLGILESRSWDGSLGQLRQLQDKVNRYLDFALDGEMHRKLPETVGQPVHVRLFYVNEPHHTALDFLDSLRTELSKFNVRFTYQRIEGS